MDMVEKVARAICEGRGLKWDDQASFMTSAGGSDEEQDGFRDDARAALEAMLEPTEGVTKAGMRAFVRYSGGDSTVDQDGANSIWTAMIDQALSDQPRPTEEKA